MSIARAFDSASEEIVKPYAKTHPVADFPDTALGIFSWKAIEMAARMPNIRQIATIKSSLMPFPVYKLERDGRALAIYQTIVGGAGSVMMMEEIAAMGARKFLLYGSCGCLDAGIAAGRLLVPSEAYRDEGASYHYAPESDYIAVNGAARLSEVFRETGVPNTLVRTWSTDAIYRETRANMEKRRAEGCTAVEMECAALAACANFRGLFFAQFLYAADSLAGKEWDARTLGSTSDDARSAYLNIAIEAALRL